MPGVLCGIGVRLHAFACSLQTITHYACGDASASELGFGDEMCAPQQWLLCIRRRTHICGHYSMQQATFC